jgi:hypothetical protein
MCDIWRVRRFKIKRGQIYLIFEGLEDLRLREVRHIWYLKG